MSYDIVIADDHWMVRDGIRQAISEQRNDFNVTGEFDNGMELLEFLKKEQPDLVILDISMPGMSGIEAAHRIKSIYPQVKILLLTMYDDPEFLDDALSAGVDGYLLKTDPEDELVESIEKIRSGAVCISPQMVSLPPSI